MPTRLLLIAHAPTEATRRAAFPLDETIEERAVGAAQSLADQLFRADRIYSAPERRARETADALGLEAETQMLLADINLGRWRGKTFDEMLEEGPEAIAGWTSNPKSRPHGGESVEELIARIRPWLDHQREDGGRVIAITHPAVIRAAITIALGAPASSFWRIDVAPLSRAELRSDGRRWTLRAIVAD
ncbi:MAG: histidine phosphatase family protein [Devosia sp.]|jgi:broad specificity phosphatase PhoE|nr:histidine phosphatase family protein [Devosiaceae bacterium]